MDINQLFANKKILILVTVLFGVIIVLFIIRLFNQPASDKVDVASPTPIASARITPNPSFTASPSAISSIRPTTYTPGELKKDSDRISNKQPLSGQDIQVKRKLIAPLLGKSGVIQATAFYQVEYVKTPDVFMVEVRSADTELAKKAAEKYLLDSGLSQAGICNLPVVFYINSKIQTTLVNSGQTFNPIPDGC